MFSWGNKQAPINGPYGDDLPPPTTDDGQGGNGNDGSGTDVDEDTDSDTQPDRDEDSDVDKKLYSSASSSAANSAQLYECISIGFVIIALVEKSASSHWRGEGKISQKLFGKAIKLSEELVSNLKQSVTLMEGEVKSFSRFEGYNKKLGKLECNELGEHSILDFPRSNSQKWLGDLSNRVFDKSLAMVSKSHLASRIELIEISERLVENLVSVQSFVANGTFFDEVLGNTNPGKTDQLLRRLVEALLAVLSDNNEEAVLYFLKFRPERPL